MLTMENPSPTLETCGDLNGDDYRKNYSKSFQKFVDKCLLRDPEKRYGNSCDVCVGVYTMSYYCEIILLMYVYVQCKLLLHAYVHVPCLSAFVRIIKIIV